MVDDVFFWSGVHFPWTNELRDKCIRFLDSEIEANVECPKMAASYPCKNAGMLVGRTLKGDGSPGKALKLFVA